MKITIKVNATFGSEHQKSFAVSCLKMLLEGWWKYLSHSHKKNRVEVIYDDGEIEEHFL